MTRKRDVSLGQGVDFEEAGRRVLELLNRRYKEWRAAQPGDWRAATVKEFAKAHGIVPNTMVKWMNEPTAPAYDHCRLLARGPVGPEIWAAAGYEPPNELAEEVAAVAGRLPAPAQDRIRKVLHAEMARAGIVVEA